jgi:hypothetical protein
MTKWALLRAFDKFERDWNYAACVVASFGRLTWCASRTSCGI